MRCKTPIYEHTAFLCIFLMFLFTCAVRNAMCAEGDSEPDYTEVAASPEVAATPKCFRILDEEKNKIITVDTDEFIVGNLFCEMSARSPTEALKAQAVASLSYFSFISNNGGDYDFSCNQGEKYVYADESCRRKEWGDNYESENSILTSAAKSVEKQLLCYNGGVAFTPFFSLSSGITECAADVLSISIPYLVNTASPYDAFSPNYEEKISFSTDEVKSICLSCWPEGKFDFERDEKEWFTEICYTAGGGVFSVNICGFSVSGDECASAFGLSGSCFTVEASDSGFLFRSKGKGKRLGMSQYGAMSMAQNGSDYMEILNHYFPGTYIKK